MIKDNYKKFLNRIGITNKTNIKNSEFNNIIWNNLAKEIKFERMIKLTNLLLIAEDEWADKKMKERRLRREYISPRYKSYKKQIGDKNE